MDKVRCSHCGAEHDLSDIELSFDQPDAYVDIPRDERERRVATNGSATVIDDRTPHGRFFLRGVIVIPVRGELHRDGFGWGAWAELAEVDFDRVMKVLQDEECQSAEPFVGHLANELGSFPGSLGLPVRLRLQPPGTAPLMDILRDDHPLGAVQRDGAYAEAILEWVSPSLH